jgi:fructokinase
MIIVTGESVADLLPAGDGLLRLALGGGPANTAVAAARLGAPVTFAARFGADTFGRAFRQRMTEAGVDLRYATDVAAPSSLALATLDASGAALYDFWLAGAADFTAAALPVPADGDILHTGSLAAYWAPGADVIEAWLAEHRHRTTITLDVNLRPIVLLEQPDALDRLERLVRLAHVVKASDDDLALAYPGREPEAVAREWLSVPGPDLVVVTEGERGVRAFARDGARAQAAAPRIDVADTIGAGDAAMGALLTAISESGLDGVAARLEETLRYVCAVAALACTRPGAYAPTAADVDASGSFAGVPGK